MAHEYTHTCTQAAGSLACRRCEYNNACMEFSRKMLRESPDFKRLIEVGLELCAVLDAKGGKHG